MTSLEQGPISRGLVDRVKAILLSPQTEWERIDAEPATVKGLFTGYACILAAIGPICAVIGLTVFGLGWAFFSYHPPIVSTVLREILQYVMLLVGTFATALIIDALAPSFDGQKNQVQAAKVAVYASTPAWVAGVFNIIPPLGALAAIVGGLYGLYLLYLGLPKLMKAPQEKAVGYTVVTIIVAIVVWVVVGWVVTLVSLGAGGAAMMSMARTGAPAGVVTVGNTRVDLGKLQAATNQMQASAANGKTTMPAVPIDTLKGFLPATLPSGYARTELSGESGGVGGIQASNAEGVYTKGDARITLKVSDMAAAGALASLGGAFGVQSDRETADGYEKVHTVNGALTSESWDNASKSGKYGVMVANRFMVEAEGSGAAMADLKGAVGAIGVDRLAGLAKG